MNLLPGVSLVRIAVYASVVLGLMGAGAWLEHGRMQKKVDAVRVKLDSQIAKHERFVGGVEALGLDARKDALEKDMWNTLNKRKADEDHARRLAADRRTIDGLRADAAARDSRGGSGAENPGGSRCPEGQVCFDRAEYQRATGEFDQRARQLADEGTKVTQDLNTCIGWINGRAP